MLGEQIVGDERLYATVTEESIKRVGKGTFSAGDVINGMRVIGFIISIAINIVYAGKLAHGTCTPPQVLHQATSAKRAGDVGNLENMTHTEKMESGSWMSSVGVDITIITALFRECASDIMPGTPRVKDRMDSIAALIVTVKFAIRIAVLMKGMEAAATPYEAISSRVRAFGIAINCGTVKMKSYGAIPPYPDRRGEDVRTTQDTEVTQEYRADSGRKELRLGKDVCGNNLTPCKPTIGKGQAPRAVGAAAEANGGRVSQKDTSAKDSRLQ